MSLQRRFCARPVRAVRGVITVPGDKSISHRALMLAGVARGRTDVTGFLESEDCLATMRALQAMGVSISRPAPACVTVDGVGLHGLRAAGVALDMGNAGTAMRLMTGLLAGQQFDSVLIGDASLMRRPMERVAAPLRQMGASIRTKEGFPPVSIDGKRALRGIQYLLPVASAQVKSALLLAGLYAEGITSVTEPAPTRDHSERMLRSFGATVEAARGVVQIEGGPELQGCPVAVPGDFSSAAFFIVAACLAAEGTFTIRGVGINPTRTGLLQILQAMGAEIRLCNQRLQGAEPVVDLEIERRELKGIAVPPEFVPLAIDEFPALFIAAACAQGTTVVTEAAELRVKESDRIAVMARGLDTLGVKTTVLHDGLMIEGGRGFSGGTVDSQGDHRIAMAFAMASTCAQASIEILDVANVATSFPGFEATARAAGLDVDSAT